MVTMSMTIIKYIIVSSGFEMFNTFINHFDQRFKLNHGRPYIMLVALCSLHLSTHFRKSTKTFVKIGLV